MRSLRTVIPSANYVTGFPETHAYIFDLDGLLINSEDISILCTNRLF